MFACCGMDLRLAVKIVGFLSSIIFALFLASSFFLLSPNIADPVIANDVIGLVAAVVFIIFGCVVFSGSAQPAVLKYEAFIAAGLIVCGFQIRNTIENWEQRSLLISILDGVSLVLVLWIILAVYVFVKTTSEIPEDPMDASRPLTTGDKDKIHIPDAPDFVKVQSMLV